MLFILNDSSELIDKFLGWEKIGPKDLTIYRLLFERRHYKLLGKQRLDYLSDLKPMTLNLTNIKRIVAANQDKYLVAQFICNAQSELSFAMCIKSKKIGSDTEDPIIKDTIYNITGEKKTEDWLTIGSDLYTKRKGIIRLAGNQEFESDGLGRAYKIDKTLIDLINLFPETIQSNFIIDELGLSIAFSEEPIDWENLSKTDDENAYNHGGACCPIE